jgi:hypothetical protein
VFEHIDALSFDDIFAHSHVKRYHTQNARPQSIAEHCYRVTMVAVKLLHLYRDCYPGGLTDGAELAVYRHALTHEVYELDFGDMPTHVKHLLLEQHGVDYNAIAKKEYWDRRNHRLPPEVDPAVRALVSLADTMEGKVLAYHTIPHGRVRDRVLQLWALAWERRADGFAGVLPGELLGNLTDQYHRNLGVDAAWA